jgi:hypothetical protein
MKHSGYIYQSLDDVNAVKNRKDRSILKICSMHPEQFLIPDVSHPHEVKQLIIILGFSNNENLHYSEFQDKHLNESWFKKYDDKLCSDIIKFHNLETLIAEDLNLSEDLWLEFSNNSKHLKEIRFSSFNSKFGDFDFYKKNKALDALFKISTLEKVSIEYVYLPYFPPGPSNIKHLKLRIVVDEYNSKKIINSYSKNLSTHININDLLLDKSSEIYNLTELKLEKLQNLEKLSLLSWNVKDIESIEQLPNLKQIYILMNFCHQDPLMTKLVDYLILKFINIEEVNIYVSNRQLYYNFDETKKYISDMLKNKCKKFIFNNEQIF